MSSAITSWFSTLEPGLTLSRKRWLLLVSITYCSRPCICTNRTKASSSNTEAVIISISRGSSPSANCSRIRTNPPCSDTSLVCARTLPGVTASPFLTAGSAPGGRLYTSPPKTQIKPPRWAMRVMFP